MDDRDYRESGEVEHDEADGGSSLRKGKRGSRKRDRYTEDARLKNPVGSLPAASFRAILADRGAIRFDADGAAKVTVEVPASEVAEVVKLVCYQGRVFTVRITSE